MGSKLTVFFLASVLWCSIVCNIWLQTWIPFKWQNLTLFFQLHYQHIGIQAFSAIFILAHCG